jgi:hypothetical protein
MGNAIGAGRRPEPDRSSVRNRVPIKSNLDVVNTPFLKGRERQLPHRVREMEDGEGTYIVAWPEVTMAYWDKLRTMPHCILWEEVDWEFAQTTALLHAAVWGEGRLEKMGELRMRERVMGMTEESRRAITIRYVDPEPDAAAEVHQLKPVANAARRKVRAIDPTA